jgi:hypothetical protein
LYIKLNIIDRVTTDRVKIKKNWKKIKTNPQSHDFLPISSIPS